MESKQPASKLKMDLAYFKEETNKMEKTAMTIALDYLGRRVVITDKFKTEMLELEKKQLIEARLDGFKISGEGFNGEYPFEGCLDKKIHEAIDSEQYYTNKFNK